MHWLRPELVAEVLVRMYSEHNLAQDKLTATLPRFAADFVWGSPVKGDFSLAAGYLIGKCCCGSGTPSGISAVASACMAPPELPCLMPVPNAADVDESVVAIVETIGFDRAEQMG